MDQVEKRFQADLLDWSVENLREFPWRAEEASPYEVLVAEMFLNVTRTSVVADVYPEFIERFPDAESLRRASREEIVEVIRPLGLYNHRADALEELAEILSEEELPRSEQELLELPRVGRYVANALLTMAFDEDRPMMDRNVARVYSRVFGLDIDEDAPGEDAWELAARLVPPGKAKRYNLSLIDFASDLCLAQNPQCGRCFANSYCKYFQAEI